MFAFLVPSIMFAMSMLFLEIIVSYFIFIQENDNGNAQLYIVEYISIMSNVDGLLCGRNVSEYKQHKNEQYQVNSFEIICRLDHPTVIFLFSIEQTDLNRLI